MPTSALAEGVMGLFDGVATPGAWGNGSTADIAAATGWPVVLVLDVSGQAQSAAAVALGFARYREDVDDRRRDPQQGRERAPRRAGARRLCAKRDRRYSARSGATTTLTMPERHLGLVQAQEDSALAGRLAALADLVERDVDLAALEAAAASDTASAARGSTSPGRRPGNASRWRATRRSPSSIRICWQAGARRAPRSSPSRRSPTSRPIPPATSPGCPAAIRNCTPASSPPRHASPTASALSRRTIRCMASAVAT